MTISLRSFLVFAPVLGVNSTDSVQATRRPSAPKPPRGPGPNFNRLIDVLAQQCIDCRESDDEQKCAGCQEPPKPANGTIATLTTFLGTSPLAESSIESAQLHFDCFNNDGDGDDCSPQQESKNNMETIKRSLTLLEFETSRITYEELQEIINAGASHRLALRTSVADAEMDEPEEPVQSQLLNNFDQWRDTIKVYVASLTEQEEKAIVDTLGFEPLTIGQFKEFLSVLYSFDVETQTPTVDEIVEMMRWFDGFLDATHALFFEHEKANDDDGNDKTLYDQEKDVIMGRATRHTFARASA